LSLPHAHGAARNADDGPLRGPCLAGEPARRIPSPSAHPHASAPNRTPGGWRISKHATTARICRIDLLRRITSLTACLPVPACHMPARHPCAEPA
ncbi:hypothetical protein, partial [Ralstonia pseudosolanacearum]|uniref:hypothetical protein n=1 Tax=Ralstonia pseudosolanacearum TaxID=1310165 RepID=UPI003D1773DE